ncbi:MAG TPA: D-glucuronyl C5-epimerase family protein [Solirubrobacteraceae bacterium]|nr:D-glucuronyl C5-epimerase family protein [Solirubrobacteraceae bacterium]
MRLPALALLLGLIAVAACPGPALAAREPSALGPLGAPVSLGAAGKRLTGTHASSAGAHVAATKGPTVTRALVTLLHAGTITEAVYKKDYATYTAAKRSLGKLTGTRRIELAAVMSNVQAMAAAGQLTASRQAVIFLTLEKNELWWTTKALLSGEVRVSFPPSKLIWEHYPGQGIEIQWLATFGEGNAYYNSGHENANLRQLVNEMIPLATQRAGGIAWEYMFKFDGGVPPWTSGLSQGTALQVLSRSWSRFKEPAYLTAAQQALGIYKVAPPQGVRVTTAAGAEYAEYTYAPSDRILNGFIQGVVGLYDYTQITKDPVGLKLFEEGDAEARGEVPHYDTGYWSLYDQFGESDLNYHELLTEFLQHLCERTRKGPPISAAPAPPPPTTTTTTPTTTTTAPAGGTAPTGGAAASSLARAAATATTTPIAGDQIYCTTAQRFTADLKTPPAVALLSKSAKAGTRAGVQISLSKISTVTMTIRQGSKVIWTNRATLDGGKPKLLWVTPTKTGTYAVTLAASDLAGNFSTTNATILLNRH